MTEVIVDNSGVGVGVGVGDVMTSDDMDVVDTSVGTAPVPVAETHLLARKNICRMNSLLVYVIPSDVLIPVQTYV